MVDYKYIVTANLYSEECNDYIYHWEGKTFNNYDDAFNFWSEWTPDDVDDQVKAWKREHSGDCLELEIGLWNKDGEDVEFFSGAV